MKNKEKGSSTIIVFVSVMFLLIMLGTTLTALAMKSKSQLIELDTLRNVCDGNMAEIYQNYNNT